MNTYLQFEAVSKRYGSTLALSEVNFGIEAGSVLALLGPNGAGKSTLFGCLLGFTHPSAGRVLLEGQSITDSSRQAFGYVAERVALYPQRTVMENAAFFARLKGAGIPEIHRQLERVGLAAVVDRKVRQLSKGMLQRLGLAIALFGAPELLVLDEPFNGLDPVLLETLQQILREENARGATLLISTHTISAVDSLATEVAILLQGRLAARGSPESLRDQHGDLTLEEIYHRIARTQDKPEEVLA
jgi:ABC-type multidrug transport system ATPase subunit